MDNVKSLENEREKLKKDYKMAMDTLHNELTDIIAKFRQRERTTKQHFETNIETLTQKIINKYKSMCNSINIDNMESKSNELESIHITSDINNINNNSNNNNNNNNIDESRPNDDNIPNCEDSKINNIKMLELNGVNNMSGVNSSDTKLLNTHKKSKYKTITIQYCNKYRIPFPIESIKTMYKDSHGYFESTIKHEYMNNKYVVKGYGIRKKEAIYDGYTKLVPKLMSTDEANMFLSKSNNVNPKSYLIEYAQRNQFPKPIVTYKVTFDKERHHNVYTAMVSFIDKCGIGVSNKKKIAERNGMQQIIQQLNI